MTTSSTRFVLPFLAVAALALGGCFTAVSNGAQPSDASTAPGADAAATPSFDAATTTAPDAGAADAGERPDAATTLPGKAGDPCVRDGDCRPGYCLLESYGYRGGYCSDTCAPGTTPSGCAGANPCIAYEDQNGPSGYCGKGCAADAECRAGYLCDPVEPGSAAKACLPGTRGKVLGDACQTRSDCAPGVGALVGLCVSEADWGYPAGYCSRYCDTTVPDSCGKEGFCHDYDATDGASYGFCFKTCAADGECRAPGYVCDTDYFGETLTAKVCLPGTRTATPVGSACLTGAECQVGMICATGKSGFPGGYCTRYCSTSNQCGGDAACLFAEPGKANSGFCMDSCASDADCRSGGRYACTAHLYGSTIVPNRVCAPQDATAAIGSKCTTIGDCPVGDYCLAETDGQGKASGFKGGYCTDSCTVTPDSCPAGAACVDFGQSGAFCLDDCANASECRASDGYQCKKPSTVATKNACWPF